MCCMVARRCPLLFNLQGPAADMHALAQIMLLLGVEAVRTAAAHCGTGGGCGGGAGEIRGAVAACWMGSMW